MVALRYLLVGFIFICHFISTANNENRAVTPDSDKNTNVISNEDLVIQQELVDFIHATNIPVRSRIPAFKALKQFPSIEATVQQKLMEFYFETNSSVIKKAIIEFFGKIQTTEATVIQKLADIANNPDIPPKTRVLAIQALGKIKPTDENTQLILVRLGIYSRYKALRRIAKLILKQVPLSETVIKKLADIANSNENTVSQRITAVQNLKRINQDSISAPLIVNIAYNTQNPEKVRIEAIQVIQDRRYYTANMYPVVQRLLAIYSLDSNSSAVRAAAHSAIENMGFSYLLPSRRCPPAFQPIPL